MERNSTSLRARSSAKWSSDELLPWAWNYTNNIPLKMWAWWIHPLPISDQSKCIILPGGGGTLNTMRCTMCHKKDSHFLSPLSPNDPLVYVLPPLDPHLLSIKDPQFLILSPKHHHFNYLAQTLISHKLKPGFKGFIACDFTTFSLKDPVIFDLSPKDPLFFWLLLSPKDPYVWGAWWHLYVTLIYECPPWIILSQFSRLEVNTQLLT